MNTQWTVPAHLHDRQWKTILRSEFGMSERLLRQIARDNAARVNGQAVFLTARAQVGNILELRLSTETSSVAPEPAALSVAYEDDEILVVNKAAGILTHPSAREQHGSLLAAAAAYLQPTGLVPHCVHRLDRDTSGLVMLAKHAHFHHLYDKALRQGLVHRTYAAIVHNPHGLLRKRQHSAEWSTIDLPVAGDPSAPSKRIVHDSGQSAVTHYQVIATTATCALVGVVLETGRTHQIRLHFAQSGFPLLGDPHYGAVDGVHPGSAPSLLNKRPSVGQLRRQALHATALWWQHPLTRKTISVSANPPADMQTFWRDVGGSADDWSQIPELMRQPELPQGIVRKD